MSCDLSLAETDSVFNRVVKGMNLQFKFMWDRICTIKHTHSNIGGRILKMSMSRRVTSVSGLKQVGDGVNIQLDTYLQTKRLKKIEKVYSFRK